MNRCNPLAGAALALLMAGATPAVAGPRYAISEVNFASPDDRSAITRVHGINRSGAIVYEGSYMMVPGNAGYRCAPDCVAVPTFTEVTRPQVYAAAINDHGMVAGSSSFLDTVHAYVFDGAVQRDIGARREGCDEPCSFHLSSAAFGISANGWVTGKAQFPGSGYDSRAFLWDPQSDVMRDLGTLGGSYSWGRAINASGWVVGHSALPGDAAEQAFISVQGRMHALGTLGGMSSWAYAINRRGQVVGCAEDGQGRTRAFVADRASGMRPLPFGQGYTASCALAVSDTGAMVGYAIDQDGTSRAKAYASGQQVVDLTQAIDASQRAGWQLERATGVNSKGQIVGWGTHNGRQCGFVLTPIRAQ